MLTIAVSNFALARVSVYVIQCLQDRLPNFVAGPRMMTNYIFDLLKSKFVRRFDVLFIVSLLSHLYH